LTGGEQKLRKCLVSIRNWSNYSVI
jgi:hypothetical protein